MKFETPNIHSRQDNTERFTRFNLYYFLIDTFDLKRSINMLALWCLQKQNGGEMKNVPSITEKYSFFRFIKSIYINIS